MVLLNTIETELFVQFISLFLLCFHSAVGQKHKGDSNFLVMPLLSQNIFHNLVARASQFVAAVNYTVNIRNNGGDFHLC